MELWCIKVLIVFLDTPLDPVFLRYFHNFDRIKNNLGFEFSEFFYVGKDGWNNFLESAFLGSGFPIWSSWHLMGLDCKKAHLRACTLSTCTIGLQQYYWLCGNSAVFALAPLPLRTSRKFHNNRVRYTDIAQTVAYNWSYDITNQKTIEVLIFWPGVAHAPIGQIEHTKFNVF